MTDDMMGKLLKIRSEIFEEAIRSEDISLYMHDGKFVSAAYELGQSYVILNNIVDRLTEIIGDEGVVE